MLDRRAQDVLYDAVAARAAAYVPYFRAVGIIIDHAMKTLQRQWGVTRFAGNIQRVQNRVILGIVMRKFSLERGMFGVKPCLRRVECGPDFLAISGIR